MIKDVLVRPVRNDADIERLLLSRVRDDPRPYAERGAFAGRAVSALLERLGNPHRGLSCIHIAGSKGKGSVALMCEHLLQHSGARTGTFTSPHLCRWNERIRIDGREVDTRTLAQTLDDMRPHLAALDEAGDEWAPSFFDVLTATALSLFAQENCDRVVIETGLGGLFDATNVVTPLACCITSIELEHTDKLGDTVHAIARHKAGIIKRATPVVTALFADSAQAVIEQQAKQLGSREWRQGRDWHTEPTHSDTLSQHIEYTRAAQQGLDAQSSAFTLPHPAAHMATNAGLAITVLAAAGWPVKPGALRDCHLPARAQVLRESPRIIVDSAHTEASLQALAQTLHQWPAGERCFVISATLGKSLHALAALLHDADCVWVTRADPLRSTPAATVAARLVTLVTALKPRVFEQPEAAFEDAEANISSDAILCVCGSVYLAGAALRYWQTSDWQTSDAQGEKAS
jgi:dihydrofolate synthase/folylpolyglutamate synthase